MVPITTGTGKSAQISSEAVEAFAASLQGDLLQPGDEGYDEARTIWNAMIDKKPALIAMCNGADDVKAAINFARENKLLTAVHGIGHNIAGNAVCDGGLMINLKPMNSVRIDTEASRAYVQPGVTLGEFDKKAQEFGLVTPLGINSTTGVAGLTLGGGFGWLSRKYGMTVDSLVGADVVTANGEFLHASEDENPELFWAIRGGGGNFGVVTGFEYQLYPLESNRFCGLMVFPLTEAESILKKYREFVAGLSDDTSVWVVLRQAPPLPFLPEEVHGTNILVFAIFHAGDPKEGEKLIAPLRTFGTMLGEHVGVMPYTDWQCAFDPLLTPGARNYWKSHNLADLSDEIIAISIRYASEFPSPHCELFFAHLGGRINRVAADATAYPHRDTNYLVNVHGRWEDGDDDKKCITWAREFFSETAPYATGGVYTNFMTDDEKDRVSAAYGSAYDRLVKAKNKYDPENLFKLNQNIAPTG